MTEQEYNQRVKKIRVLSETDKVALICSQHYQINQIQDRVEQLKCAHETGQCVICKDKDKTIEEQNEVIKALQAKLYGRYSERKRKSQRTDDGPKKAQSTKRVRLPAQRAGVQMLK